MPLIIFAPVITSLLHALQCLNFAFQGLCNFTLQQLAVGEHLLQARALDLDTGLLGEPQSWNWQVWNKRAASVHCLLRCLPCRVVIVLFTSDAVHCMLIAFHVVSY